MTKFYGYKDQLFMPNRLVFHEGSSFESWKRRKAEAVAELGIPSTTVNKITAVTIGAVAVLSFGFGIRSGIKNIHNSQQPAITETSSATRQSIKNTCIDLGEPRVTYSIPEDEGESQPPNTSR